MYPTLRTITTAVLAAWAIQSDTGRLTAQAEFTKLHALIKPRADESQVERVPWTPTIWEARVKAAAEGKPIFIWVTGGPPGGC